MTGQYTMGSERSPALSSYRRGGSYCRGKRDRVRGEGRQREGETRYRDTEYEMNGDIDIEKRKTEEQNKRCRETERLRDEI